MCTRYVGPSNCAFRSPSSRVDTPTDLLVLVVQLDGNQLLVDHPNARIETMLPPYMERALAYAPCICVLHNLDALFGADGNARTASGLLFSVVDAVAESGR